MYPKTDYSMTSIEKLKIKKVDVGLKLFLKKQTCYEWNNGSFV